MLTSVFATKIGMTQAWTTSGKRLAVTRCKVDPMSVVGELTPATEEKPAMFEIGYGRKKLKNMTKPLRSKLEKSGFSYGVKTLQGMPLSANAEGVVPTVGSTIKLEAMLSVGDVVKVQGVTKGRGFAGAMKRHGFRGTKKTHGQSDRQRAVGSIGSGTTPGRVVKGKRMPGRFGNETQTIQGLTVVYIDPTTQEVWLSGPVPGAANAAVSIRKTGTTKEIALDLDASGLQTPVVTPEVEETPVETPAAEEVAPAVEATPEAVESPATETPATAWN